MLSIFKKRPKAGQPSGLSAIAGSEAHPHHIRFNGHSAGILDIHDGGQRINVCVFQRGHDWNAGDYVIFERQSGETTRYKIDRIWTPRDPGDQHFLYCTFAPRPAPSPNT
jgi:hypothetical protein